VGVGVEVGVNVGVGVGDGAIVGVGVALASGVGVGVDPLPNATLLGVATNRSATRRTRPNLPTFPLELIMRDPAKPLR